MDEFTSNVINFHYITIIGAELATIRLNFTDLSNLLIASASTTSIKPNFADVSTPISGLTSTGPNFANPSISVDLQPIYHNNHDFITVLPIFHNVVISTAFRHSISHNEPNSKDDITKNQLDAVHSCNFIG